MRKKFLLYFILSMAVCTISFTLSSPGYAQKKTTKKKSASKKTTVLYGTASYYAQKFQGRKTASGENFDHMKFTAACNALPIGTWIKVTNLKNGKFVYVRVNDRLHSNTSRIVDLTKAAARRLGILNTGLTRVKVEVEMNKPD